MNLHHAKQSKSSKPGDIVTITYDLDDGCVICDHYDGGNAAGWAIKGDMFLVIANINQRAYVLSFAHGLHRAMMGWINTSMISNATD